ncbi:MAG: energy transducer TonB [Bacteroidales bacterium]|jgi:hypothetical protein|nr:energy transducer TonB [Bacteroidales bacterium]
MRTLMLFVSFVLITAIVHGQKLNKPIYLNAAKKESKKKDAVYYRVISQSSDSLYDCRDFWLSGELESFGRLRSIEPRIREGEYTWYHKNGNVKQIMTFQDNEIKGLVQNFDGDGRFIFESHSDLDSIDNREELINAIDQFGKFFQKKFKIPDNSAENGVEGTGMAVFCIYPSGSVEYCEILWPLDDEIDKEIIRIIKSYDKWPVPVSRGKSVYLMMSFPVIVQIEERVIFR